MNNRTDILDLRTALAVLRELPGQLVETHVEVDPAAELSGVYRYVGAGGTVMRPTTVDGPAMVFHNIKGHPDASVAIGVLASRARVAALFGCRKEELGRLVQQCAAAPIQPIVTTAPAPCQEVVHLATDPDFDLNTLILAPTNTPVDAGPYITLGMVVVPCSMKTAAGIATGYSDNLLLRAVDVTLKERRKLVLVARESPLSTLHLRNLCTVSELGAVVLPPVPAYYRRPRTVEDCTAHTVSRILSQFDLDEEEYQWSGL